MLLLQDSKPHIYISNTGGNQKVTMSIEYIDILIILLVILLVIYWSLLLYFYCERWHLKRPERSTKNGK